MAAGWAAIASAAISSMFNAGATMGANAGNSHQAKVNRAFQAEQAAANRKWLEKMSNTAHQREVKDLIAAGLNPILSANGGASTPSSGSPSGAQANIEAPQIDGNAIVNGILQTRALNQRQEQIPYENEKTWQEAQLIMAQTNTELQNAKLRALQVVTQDIDNQLKRKELNYYDRQKLTELKLRATETMLNTAKTAQTRAQEWRLYNEPLTELESGVEANILGNSLNYKNGEIVFGSKAENQNMKYKKIGVGKADKNKKTTKKKGK